MTQDAADFGFTVRPNCLVLLPAAFDAASVKEEEPAVLGTPLITPFEAFKERPLGNAPLVRAHVIGVVPELLMVREYDVPTVPTASGDVVVMEGAV